ncbi:MAG: mandelate racemase/muconate lactonizing enzyme family protein [Rhodospirillales bacterium]|nr:mandelate racemase/muconate lactonizing enzyme family protein [Rhodospirillales bacterium]
MTTIEEVTLTRLAVPLSEPYKLSLGPVTQFDTILVRMVGREGSGIGEATILTGYTDETIADSWALACNIAAELPGIASGSAKHRIAQHFAHAPFTATALATAIEMTERDPLLEVAEPVGVALLGTVNATGDAAMAAEIERYIREGYRTLKMKVGFDVSEDLARVARAQGLAGGRARLRIDANQGYTCEEGCWFAAALEPQGIELLEQPCDAKDWKSAEDVARISTVPLMLDESIYGEEDIDRAAAIGARYVKLKLMKLGNLGRLDAALGRIRALGMEPVLGNGVATEIGCWMEACIARFRISNAGEMNGFLKQSAPLVQEPFRISDGMLWLAPEPPRLDEAAVARVTVGKARFGAPFIAQRAI